LLLHHTHLVEATFGEHAWEGHGERFDVATVGGVEATFEHAGLLCTRLHRLGNVVGEISYRFRLHLPEQIAPRVEEGVPQCIFLQLTMVVERNKVLLL